MPIPAVAPHVDRGLLQQSAPPNGQLPSQHPALLQALFSLVFPPCYFDTARCFPAFGNVFAPMSKRPTPTSLCALQSVSSFPSLTIKEARLKAEAGHGAGHASSTSAACPQGGRDTSFVSVHCAASLHPSLLHLQSKSPNALLGQWLGVRAALVFHPIRKSLLARPGHWGFRRSERALDTHPKWGIF